MARSLIIMQTNGLIRVGGFSAFLYVLGAFALLGAISSVPDLAGAVEVEDFLPIMAEHQTAIAVASWLLLILPFLIGATGLGFLEATRKGSPLAAIGAYAFVAGALLAAMRGSIWLAMTYELAPAYQAADPEGQVTLAAVAKTLDGIAFFAADMLAGFLIPGIGTPLFTWAAYRAGLVRKWVMGLGIFVGVFGGLFTLLGPFHEILELISFAGFVAFWVWLIVMALAVLRTPRTKAQVRTSGAGPSAMSYAERRTPERPRH